MKKLVLAMTVLSMFGLSVACNKGADKSDTQSGSGSQMEQKGSGSDMGSGSSTPSSTQGTESQPSGSQPNP